jgi:hypothetical protein
MIDPTTARPAATAIAVNQGLSLSRWVGDVVSPLAYIERRIAPQMIAVSGTIDQAQTLGDLQVAELPTLGFEGNSDTAGCSFFRERGPFIEANYHVQFRAESRNAPTAESVIDGTATGETSDFPATLYLADVSGVYSGPILSTGAERGGITTHTGAQVEVMRYDVPVTNALPYLVIMR